MNTGRPLPERGSVERMLTIQQIARLLGKHRNTLHRWIKRGVFPTPDKRVNRTPFWMESTLKIWQSSS